MADYYTPTVFEPCIPLSAMLPIERLFLAQVFDEEIADETAYYYSEDGANDLIFLPAADVRAALDGAKPDTSRLAPELLDEQPDAILGEDDLELDMCGALWADVLPGIVRPSPDLHLLPLVRKSRRVGTELCTCVDLGFAH